MSGKNKYMQLASNTILFALGNLGSKFLVFFLMPLYTHELTTAEYGISELVLTGTNLLIPFVSLSIQDATIRFALDKNNDNKEVLKNTVLMISIGSGVIVLISPLLGLYQPIAEWKTYFSVITIAYMIRNALSVYMKGVEKTKIFAIDSLIYTFILMIANILLLTVFKMHLQGYFIAIIISTCFSICFLLVAGGILGDLKESKINTLLLKEMIIFSMPMILNNVSWWIINSSDKVMIERCLTVSASGIYSVAAKMPSILTMLTNIFNQAWMISSVTEYDSTKDERFYADTFSAFNFVMIFFAVFMVVIIKPFMHIYVGADFAQSWKYVPLLLLGSIFQSYAAFFGALYTSAKKNISVMLTTLGAAVINLCLNFILIPIWGIQGAVVATAVAYLAIFIFRMFDSQKYVKFAFNGTKIVGSILVLIIQSIANIVEWYSYLISIISIIALITINFSEIKKLIIKVNGILVKIKSRH